MNIVDTSPSSPANRFDFLPLLELKNTNALKSACRIHRFEAWLLHQLELMCKRIMTCFYFLICGSMSLLTEL